GRQGVAESEIYDALEQLLLAVRKTGVDEETEEQIHGVMDRLTGWCHPASAIKTARSTLPSEEEIAKLPRWAQVAFGARCARRVLPLFLQKWPDAPEEHIARLVWAVETGEKSAASAGKGGDWAPPAGAIVCAAYVCDAVINADRDRRRATEVIMATAV